MLPRNMSASARPSSKPQLLRQPDCAFGVRQRLAARARSIAEGDTADTGPRRSSCWAGASRISASARRVCSSRLLGPALNPETAGEKALHFRLADLVAQATELFHCLRQGASASPAAMSVPPSGAALRIRRYRRSGSSGGVELECGVEEPAGTVRDRERRRPLARVTERGLWRRRRAPTCSLPSPPSARAPAGSGARRSSAWSSDLPSESIQIATRSCFSARPARGICPYATSRISTWRNEYSVSLPTDEAR